LKEQKEKKKRTMISTLEIGLSKDFGHSLINRIIRQYVRIVIVTSEDDNSTLKVIQKYPKLFNSANKIYMFDTPDSTKLNLMEQLLKEYNAFNLKGMDSSENEMTLIRNDRTNTSMENLLENKDNELKFKNIGQSFMKIFESVKREEKLLDGKERVRWKNLQRIVQSYGLLFPNNMITLDTKIKRLKSCLNFLGEIDKESFEREKRISTLEKKLQTDKMILEKLSKKKLKFEKSIERMSKKMKEYIYFSKSTKMYDSLSNPVKIMLKHFCKVNQSNYEMGLEEATNEEMKLLAIKGNRSKIGNRLLKNTTFKTKIKNFWELKISWRMFMSINFSSILKVFQDLKNKEEDPNLFMLSVINKFCRFVDGKQLEIDEKQEKANESKIDFDFLINFFTKFNSEKFITDLNQFKFIKFKDTQIVNLTREIILFNHQASLEKIYGNDLALLNVFIKRFLLYVDKEIKFVVKTLYKGQPKESTNLLSELNVGPENSPMEDNLQALFREFFSQEDANIYLELFQQNFLIKRRANNIEKELVTIDQELRDLLDKRRKSQSIGAKLSFEVQEWKIELETSQLVRAHLEGNCIMALSILEYCPRFPRKVRKRLKDQWKKELSNQGLGISSNFDLADFILSPMEKEKVKFKELSSINEHFEDILSLEDTELFCALIDPHWLIQDYLVRYFIDLDSVIINVSDESAGMIIKKAIVTGQLLILLKHNWENVNPSVLRLLERDIKEEKGQQVIDLGDKICKIHENFRCYLVVENEESLGSYIANIVKIVNLKEFVEIEMEEHLLGVLRRREQVNNEELRKGLLYEKLEEKFQVDSLKNELLGKILDHLRETETEEEYDTEQKILELQEDLVNVAEALNITKLTIRERKRETDGILMEIDHKRDEMLLLVREFKEIYLLHKGLQIEGKAHGMGFLEIFEVFFPQSNMESEIDSWKRDSESKKNLNEEKNEETEQKKIESDWISNDGINNLSKSKDRLRVKLQSILHSVEPNSRRSFLMNCAMRLSLLEEKISLEAFSIFLIVIKQIYLKNLESIKLICKKDQIKGKKFWKETNEVNNIKKAEEMMTVPGWKIHQLCEDIGFNSKLVYNLSEESIITSGKEGIDRFFESEWITKKKSKANHKSLGKIDAEKLMLIDILEELGNSKWEGLFDKVKQNLIKEKNMGGILCKQTLLKDLKIIIRGQDISTFLKMVIVTIFNPERLCELVDEYIELELGKIMTHPEGDWHIIREKLYEEKNLNMLVHVHPENKIDFYEKLMENPPNKEIVVLRQGGLFPINREFLIEYAQKSSFGKRNHTSEEKNFWKIIEENVEPKDFQLKDLQDFLKRCQFQGKLVIIDVDHDHKLMRMLSNILTRMKKDGDETDEGAVIVLFNWKESNVKENYKIRKTFQEGLSDFTRIEGDFFSCKSHIINKRMPTKGFTSWAYFDTKKSLQNAFDRNFRELIQDMLDLEDDINDFDIRNNSKATESHFDPNQETQSEKSNSVNKMESETIKGRLDG
jgi:hypothetical protein